MERHFIAFALSACLTLGFFSAVSAYRPAKTAARIPNQLRVKAEPVALTEVLDNITGAVSGEFLLRKGEGPFAGAGQAGRPLKSAVSQPPQTQATPQAPVTEAVLPFWMESEPAEGVDVSISNIRPGRFPLKVYKPMPAAPRSAFPSRFRPHADLLPMVEFWRNVYGNYDLHHTLLHDSENLNLVYGVLDFEGINKNLRSKIESIKKAELKAMLLRLDRGDKPVTAGEHLIVRLFENIHDRDKFKTAADQIRGQWGQRSRFEEGLIRSGRYLPT
ncbi:MAG: hypothetical protein HY609_03495, partial [Deltaproteobacteria bacterium]|nr:hypothetical protein [Deltaproteobacteria bacterium]